MLSNTYAFNPIVLTIVFIADPCKHDFRWTSHLSRVLHVVQNDSRAERLSYFTERIWSIDWLSLFR